MGAGSAGSPDVMAIVGESSPGVETPGVETPGAETLVLVAPKVVTLVVVRPAAVRPDEVAAGGALTGIRCTSGLMMGGSGPISGGLVGAGTGGTGGHSPVPLKPVGRGVDETVDGVGLGGVAG